LANRAGVEHDDPRVGSVLDPGVAVGLEQPRDALGVVLVHLAAEGANQVPAGHCRQSTRGYLAYSTARSSRTTVILIWPGYCSSSSTCFAMSRARTCAARSSTSPGVTMTRTSRPACMANTFSTPG